MSRRPIKTLRTSQPERYVVWRNDGPRAHDKVVFDDDNVVIEWVCLREVSVPERFSDQCENLGLTKVRYANS